MRIEKKLVSTVFLLLFNVLVSQPSMSGSARGTAMYLSNFHNNETILFNVDNNINNKSTSDSLMILNRELTRDPNNTVLLYKEASLFVDTERYNEALIDLDRLAILDPSNKAANKLRQVAIQKAQCLAHNDVGFNQEEDWVSSNGYWNFSSVFYHRLTEYGVYGARINYARRNGSTGVQYQLEAYPKFWRSIVPYLTTVDLLFAYADDSQVLYPTFAYSVEPYFNLPQGVQVSLGARVIKTQSQNIYFYTGTLGKYFGDYFAWFRPTVSTPKSHVYYEFNLRRFFSDANNYAGIKVGFGGYPDLADIAPLDQIIVLDAYAIAFDGQYALQHDLFINGAVSYTHQQFKNGNVRELTAVNVGMTYRFA